MTVADYIEAYFPTLAAASIGCAGAFSLIQTIKMARRECSAPRVPNVAVRGLAFVFSGGITTITGYRLFGIDVEKAFALGLVIAILYPVIMAVIMAMTARYQPEVYRRLQIPTRRPTDRRADAGKSVDEAPKPARDPHDDTVERFF